MIISESYKDGKFIRHYSDQGLMIRKVGTNEIYVEAVDLLDKGYQYKETDISIEPELEED